MEHAKGGVRGDAKGLRKSPGGAPAFRAPWVGANAKKKLSLSVLCKLSSTSTWFSLFIPKVCWEHCNALEKCH